MSSKTITSLTILTTAKERECPANKWFTDMDTQKKRVEHERKHNQSSKRKGALAKRNQASSFVRISKACDLETVHTLNIPDQSLFFLD